MPHKDWTIEPVMKNWTIRDKPYVPDWKDNLLMGFCLVAIACAVTFF